MINDYKSIFILGIGGTGMSSIAKYLNQRRAYVSGYDQRKSFAVEKLSYEGIRILNSLENEKYESEILYIYSSAINIENTFLANYKNKKNVLTRPKFLELLSYEVDIIGVTGTHGKTSTTALLSHIFQFNNINVSYIYGGVSSLGNLGGHFGDPSLPLILETDEAFNTFENIQIKDLLVTNIDNDHIDYYGNFNNLKLAFEHVINKSKDNVVLNIDDQILYKYSDVSKFTYSQNMDSNLKVIPPNKLFYKNKKFQVQSNFIGEQYLMNIAGAILIADIYGINIEKSLSAIKSFPGVKRRMEFKGTKDNVKVYDDYGHHPTAILKSINSLKMVTEGELYVVFQPHRFTRTRDNFKELKNSLETCNNVVVLDIYAAGEDPIPGISSKNFESNKITYIDSMSKVPEYLNKIVKSGDCILTLGAGDVTLLGNLLLEI